MNDLELLSDVAQLPPGDEVERHARAVAHARLRAAIAAPPKRRRRLGLPLPPLAVGAAVAAAVIVVIAWPRGADVEREASSSVLPGPGQYFYSQVGIRAGDGSLPRVRELWLAPDGSGRIVIDVVDGGMDVTELGGEHEPWSVYAGRLDYDAVTALPTDVDALARYVDEVAFGRPRHAEAQFLMVGDLLREAPVPPELSRALFAVAERLPGVKTAPAGAPFGRGATRVSFRVGRLRRDLIRDANGVLLTDQLLRGGTVMESYLMGPRGVVDALGERP